MGRALPRRTVLKGIGPVRFGFPRLHALLRREGQRVNHKRMERIYSRTEVG